MPADLVFPEALFRGLPPSHCELMWSLFYGAAIWCPCVQISSSYRHQSNWIRGDPLVLGVRALHVNLGGGAVGVGTSFAIGYSPESQMTGVAPSSPYRSAWDESRYLSIHEHLFSTVCITKIKKKLSPNGLWSCGSNGYTQQRS